MNSKLIKKQVIKINNDFQKWYDGNNVSWKKQKRWLTKRLVKSKLISKTHSKLFWKAFDRNIDLMYELCDGNWDNQLSILKNMVVSYNKWSNIGY